MYTADHVDGGTRAATCPEPVEGFASYPGHEQEVGAVVTGYFGDLVAVEGDPLADKVKWVMKGEAVVADKTKGQVLW